MKIEEQHIYKIILIKREKVESKAYGSALALDGGLEGTMVLLGRLVPMF